MNNDSGAFRGTITNNGRFVIEGAGNITPLILNGNVTLQGTGSLNLVASGAVRGANSILTNASTIQGWSDTNGSFGFDEIGIVNQATGVIDANTNIQILRVDPNAANGLVNQGIMRASNGGILLLSGFGGGGFDNTAGTISAADGAEVRLSAGAEINGGTLSTAGLGLFRITNNDSGAFRGTITNNGLFLIEGGGNLTTLFLNGNVTLQGSGILRLAASALVRGSGLLMNASTIQGWSDGNGTFGGDEVGIVNQASGVIDANVSGAPLRIDPRAADGLVNFGTMRASNGGTLLLSGFGGGGFDNRSTIEVVGSSALDFQGAVTSSGLVDVGSGTLSVSGAGNFTQTAGTFRLLGGTVTSASALQFQGGLVDARGTINGAIANNAMLRPALGGSGLNINGNLSLLGSSQLIFNLGGLTQGSQYGFVNVNGNVSLGGQLVLSFVNGFQTVVTNSDSFTLMSSSGAFVGTFANIGSGNRLTTSGGEGSFLVSYSGSNLVLSNFLPPGPNLVTANWLNATSGTWNTATNWSTNPNFPNNGTPSNTVYNAVIAATGAPYTVTLNSPITVQGFTLNSPDVTLSLNGGGMLETAANSFVTAGTLFVSGGTLRGGNITVNGGTFSFAANGNNILDAVTVNGTLTFPGGGFARLTNGTSFTQANLSGNNTTLIVEGTTATPASTLSGALINLDSGAGSSTFGLSGNMTLTLAPSTTVRGQGTISSDLQFSGLGTLINQGLISADVAARPLTINADVFTNQGTARAINGATLAINSANWSNPTGTLSVNASTLNLGGTFTSPGAISRTGGTINITGLWNNVGNTYTLNTTTGDFQLGGGTIRGGSIIQSGGALSFAANGNNILDAVAITGTLQFPSGGFARLQNGTSFTQADVGGNNTFLIVEGTAATPASTLSGSLINLDSGAGSSAFGLSGNMTLTLAASTTVRGQGTIGSDLQFSGLGTLINQGLISADVSTRSLTINPDVFTNQGTTRVINGATLNISSASWNNNTGTLGVNASTLNLGGTFTNPGAISRTGGTINITGLVG